MLQLVLGKYSEEPEDTLPALAHLEAPYIAPSPHGEIRVLADEVYTLLAGRLAARDLVQSFQNGCL